MREMRMVACAIANVLREIRKDTCEMNSVFNGTVIVAGAMVKGFGGIGKLCNGMLIAGCEMDKSLNVMEESLKIIMSKYKLLIVNK